MSAPSRAMPGAEELRRGLLPARRWRASFRSPSALACAMAVGLVLLRLLPPGLTRALAPCPLHELTGLLCPGCGSTRALLALVHGDLNTAWRLNPLFVLLLAPGGVYLGSALRLGRFPALPRWVTGALVAIAVVFAVGRNLGT